MKNKYMIMDTCDGNFVSSKRLTKIKARNVYEIGDSFEYYCADFCREPKKASKFSSKSEAKKIKDKMFNEIKRVFKDKVNPYVIIKVVE